MIGLHGYVNPLLSSIDGNVEIKTNVRPRPIKTLCEQSSPMIDKLGERLGCKKNFAISSKVDHE